MPDFSPDDTELLSSHLDGELTAHETAIVEERLATEPDLAARLGQLRDASALVATPVTPLPPDAVAGLIAAALEAGDTAANVTDLAAAGARRPAWRTRIAAIAAGGAAIAISVTALNAINDDSSEDTVATFTRDDTATSSVDGAAVDDVEPLDADVGAERDAASKGVDDGTEDPIAETTDMAGMAEPPAAAAVLDSFGFEPLEEDLGEFESTSALLRAVRGEVAFALADNGAGDVEPTTGKEPADDTVAPQEVTGRVWAGAGKCPDLISGLAAYGFDDAAVAADLARATVAGEPVTVGLFELADGTIVLLLFDPATCEVGNAVAVN